VSKPEFTVFIGACVIAAIRLAREDKLFNTPKSVATISDSVALAKKIYEHAAGPHPQLFEDRPRG